jgi:hypothetical protein
VSLKKPPHRGQGHRKRLALVPSVAAAAVPVAPEGLSGTVLADWHAFWRTDFARIINWERDQRAISRLFRLYSLEARLEEAGEQTFLLGSQGQQILNPALRQLATVQTEILALEKQFGMTTQSAAGLGLSLGSLRKTLEERNREANAQAAKPRRA